MTRPCARLFVENPACSTLLAQVDAGRGVAFAKRTHGIWDHLALLMTHGWRADGWRRCDMMIFKEIRLTDPSARPERRDYMRYLNEILDDVRNPTDDDRWWRTVSLDLEYLTRKLTRPAFELRLSSDPRLNVYWDWRYSYADVFVPLGLSGLRWRYAQTLTAGVRDLSVLELPVIARQFHVVAVAPEKVRDLPRRWTLDEDRFTFVPSPRWPSVRPAGSLFTDPVLPALQTHRMRHELLAQLSAVSSDRPLLYVFELGTCAQWLIHRLFRARPEHAYLDLGRVLELWYPDHPWPLKKPVASLYRRAAKAYYGERGLRELIT